MRFYYCISFYADVPNDTYDDLNEAIMNESKHLKTVTFDEYLDFNPEILTVEVQEA